jgi:cytochrome c peroxidase
MKSRFKIVASRALGIVFCVLAELSSAATDAPHLLGLPAMVAPTVNPMTSAKIELGRKLFFDKRLSANGKVSCATCHIPGKAFTDAKPLAEGIEQRRGTRNTPTLINSGYNAAQFWEGRRASLEEQVLDPFVNPNEHGLPNQDEIVRRIHADKTYRPMFKNAFRGDSLVTPVHVNQALASFVRSLAAGNSSADRYLYGGDNAALSGDQRRGLELFRGRAQCTTCHTMRERDALFTDHDYHSLSIGFDRLAPKLAGLARRIAKTPRAELDQLILSDADVAALGRFVITLDPKDIGRFKTPSLRNVALTAPYMHDGSIPTLEAAVDHEIYYRGQAMGRPLVLTPLEKSELVAFLQALTCAELPH